MGEALWQGVTFLGTALSAETKALPGITIFHPRRALSVLSTTRTGTKPSTPLEERHIVRGDRSL